MLRWSDLSTMKVTARAPARTWRNRQPRRGCSPTEFRSWHGDLDGVEVRFDRWRGERARTARADAEGRADTGGRRRVRLLAGRQEEAQDGAAPPHHRRR